MDVTFSLPPAQVLTFVSVFVLPILVGLVNKRSASGGSKAVQLAALAMASQFIGLWLIAINSGSTFDMGQALVLGLETLVGGIAAHYGLYKQIGVASLAADTLVKDKPGKHRA